MNRLPDRIQFPYLFSQGIVVVLIFTELMDESMLILCGGSWLFLFRSWLQRKERHSSAGWEWIFALGGLLAVWMMFVWRGEVEAISFSTILYGLGGAWLWRRFDVFLSHHMDTVHIYSWTETWQDILWFILAVPLGFIYQVDVKVGMVYVLFVGATIARLYAFWEMTRRKGQGKEAKGGIFSSVLWLWGAMIVFILTLLKSLVATSVWMKFTWMMRFSFIWIFYHIGEVFEPLFQSEYKLPKGKMKEPPSFAEDLPYTFDENMMVIVSILLLILLVVYWIKKRPPQERADSQPKPSSAEELRQFIGWERKASIQKRNVKDSPTWIRRRYREYLLHLRKQGERRFIGETAKEFAHRMEGDYPGSTELTNVYMQERYGEKEIESQRNYVTRLLQAIIKMKKGFMKKTWK
ncbi:DUF4129 domain-containing protein [Marininema halotolerans]|uniref:DUF4129 domain-containing protein n=1 Tax=Marininema halotolerans TaxID=1155944 RepID=A0A1I6P7W0_9BACL|nr:DUF4129 domain-containing protein [Marininema halotolerans]SFS36269.1 hypothetical protein SAMN05444972_101416 [Marininema halotolerans]